MVESATTQTVCCCLFSFLVAAVFVGAASFTCGKATNAKCVGYALGGTVLASIAVLIMGMVYGSDVVVAEFIDADVAHHADEEDTESAYYTPHIPGSIPSGRRQPENHNAASEMYSALHAQSDNFGNDSLRMSNMNSASRLLNS